MWLLGEAASSGDGGANLYTLLIVVAGLLLGSGGFLRWWAARHRPEVEPEPVARRAAESVESFLAAHVRRQDRQLAEKDRQIHAMRVEYEGKLDGYREQVLTLTRALSTCQAERTDLMYRLHERGDRDE